MSEKILFVDDEPPVLEGYRRLLHKDFAVATAVGGEQGLAAISHCEPYAVVVSDMRMPKMDGVEFLSRVRAVSPDTVRIALTGYADMETAIGAVNEGCIFRFLTKPCSKETLAKALTAGLVQYRLITAERDLLEKTLRGTIKVLTEVLSAVNPAAFSRAMRVRRYVQHIVTKRNLGDSWKFEVAAMMSQLGCVTLHPDTVSAIYAGQSLTPEEQTRLESHPLVARDLLMQIPRMEPIASMIAQQAGGKTSRDAGTDDIISQGARILNTALVYDELLCKDHTQEEALSQLRMSRSGDDVANVEALSDLGAEAEGMEVRSCQINELTSGMILQADIWTESGLLVVAKGQEVTYSLIIRLRNFLQRKAISGSAIVAIPQTKKEAVWAG